MRALLPNPDKTLVPGMLMTLNLRRNPLEAILISEETIVPRGGDTCVFVVDEAVQPATAERRTVTLGRRFAGKVEVYTGLNEGEHVVSHGTLKVRPGAPVRILAVDDGTRSIAEIIRAETAASA